MKFYLDSESIRVFSFKNPLNVIFSVSFLSKEAWGLSLAAEDWIVSSAVCEHAAASGGTTITWNGELQEAQVEKLRSQVPVWFREYKNLHLCDPVYIWACLWLGFLIRPHEEMCWRHQCGAPDKKTESVLRGRQPNNLWDSYHSWSNSEREAVKVLQTWAAVWKKRLLESLNDWFGIKPGDLHPSGEEKASRCLLNGATSETRVICSIITSSTTTTSLMKTIRPAVVWSHPSSCLSLSSEHQLAPRNSLKSIAQMFSERLSSPLHHHGYQRDPPAVSLTILLIHPEGHLHYSAVRKPDCIIMFCTNMLCFVFVLLADVCLGWKMCGIRTRRTKGWSLSQTLICWMC